jgi:hypothetical protein
MSEESSATQLEQLRALAVSLHASRNDLLPRLLPGRIPEDCPLQIPEPPHTRLLGTLAHSHRVFVIMLESDLSLNEALSVYRMQLAALEWKEQGKVQVWPEGQTTGESVWSGVHPSIELTFWHPSIQPLLIGHTWLTLMEREDATTLVRLHVVLSRQGFLQAQPEPAPPDVLGPRHRAVHLLPTLVAPAGAQLRHQRSHVGPAEIQMTSEVTTPLDLVVLGQHFTKQLHHTWTQMEAGSSGPFVWSTWQFTSIDPEPATWSALFLILKMPDKPDHYILDLRALRSKPEAAS